MSGLMRKAASAIPVFAVLLAATFALPSPIVTRAADHSEAPVADEDRPNDIGDVFAFLDPNDNSKVVFAFTLVGFIVPSELANQGAFDAHSRYRIELEETGDARADRFIDVTFSERTARSAPQIATITLPDGRMFTAPTTPPSLGETSPAPTVTADATSGAAFFAGPVDDPFFFDIPAFNRFVSSVLAGTPDASQLARGRDSFAGYNTMGVALSVPASLLRTADGAIGVSLLTQRQSKKTFRKATGDFIFKGPYTNIDRMGNPAINTALIPFPRKDEYNFATTQDDANGKFANDIVATLTALGTDQTNIGILAGVAVAKGDFLRLNLATANAGTGGGNNAGAGFPNGRRLGDDTIDTILFFIANQNTLGDNVNSNDVPLSDSFPFFGRTQQPRAAGTIDDLTRN